MCVCVKERERERERGRERAKNPLVVISTRVIIVVIDKIKGSAEKLDQHI